ncbi:UNVERIFIED_CONTAM: hypothetical protein RMT77_003923 [Armadillidium vulgare]
MKIFSYKHLCRKYILNRVKNLVFVPSNSVATNPSTAKSWNQLYLDFVREINEKGVKNLDDKFIPVKHRKQKADGDAENHFVDHSYCKIIGGNGGDGFICLSEIWCNPNAGPDGGDGGNGGHVILKATRKKKSLNHLRSLVIAENGVDGASKSCHGKSAPNKIEEVPVGTVIKYNGTVVATLFEEGDMYLAAKGGAGGKGNTFFATSVNQAPKVAEFGGLGEAFRYELELQVIADIGLVGFPNAGKSTLLRAVSRARPRVASYPFTTLNPFVGMVTFADHHQMAIADIPGLIKGSHKNLGLGVAFLKHIRRCSCLLYVLDASEGDPLEQFEILREELESYEKGLSDRPHAFVLNKMDLPQAQENLPRLQKHLSLPIMPISGKMGQNLVPLLAVMRLLSEQNVKS